MHGEVVDQPLHPRPPTRGDGTPVGEADRERQERREQGDRPLTATAITLLGGLVADVRYFHGLVVRLNPKFVGG